QVAKQAGIHAADWKVDFPRNLEVTQAVNAVCKCQSGSVYRLRILGAESKGASEPVAVRIREPRESVTVTESGVIIEGDCRLGRLSLSKLVVDPALPRVLVTLVAGETKVSAIVVRGKLCIHVLTEVGKQSQLVVDGVVDPLCQPLRVDIRVPDHRCGVDRVRHLASLQCEPRRGAPAEVHLANIDA